MTYGNFKGLLGQGDAPTNRTVGSAIQMTTVYLKLSKSHLVLQ